MTMILLCGLTAASVLAFLLAFWLLKIVPVARDAIGTLQGTMAQLRDPDLDDLAREKAAQSAGIKLIGSAFSLLLRSVVALAAAAIPLWLADLAGIMPLSSSIAFLERWDVILVTSVIMIALWFGWSRFWRA